MTSMLFRVSICARFCSHHPAHYVGTPPRRGGERIYFPPSFQGGVAQSAGVVGYFAASLICVATTSGYPLNQSVTLTSLPPFTWKICTHPPPSWSLAVSSSGGTSPPSVKPLIFSIPALTSAPVIFWPPLAFNALRI